MRQPMTCATGTPGRPVRRATRRSAGAMASEVDHPNPNARPIAERVEELLAAGGPLPIVAAGDPVLRRGTEPFEGRPEGAWVLLKA